MLRFTASSSKSLMMSNTNTTNAARHILPTAASFSTMMRSFSSSTTTSSTSHHHQLLSACRGTVKQTNYYSSAASASTSMMTTSKRFCSSDATSSKQQPPVTILYSTTPNSDSLRFYSMELSFLPPGSTLDLPNEGHSYKSPLAEMLFKCQGVASVYISDEYITVTKEEGTSWEQLTDIVKECIVEFAHSGLNILSEEGEQELESGHPDTEPHPDDSEVLLAIKELLATRIRPMLAMDGGGMKFIAFEDGLVYLVLEGACKTCSSKGNTLKVGIERMLMHWIPEVAEVVEVDELWAEDYKAQFKEEQEKLKKSSSEQEEGEPAAATTNGAVNGAEKQ